jgi:CheY-like chemotaxis protein
MKRVLIAEDDRVLSARIEKALGRYAETVSFKMAADGKEAITLLEEETVDLVVTDIQMPRMNGLVLLAYIHTYHPSTPCVVTTSYGTARMRAKIPGEVLRFFQKPYDPDDLARSILAALDREPPRELPDGMRLMAFLNMIEVEKISCGFKVTTPEERAGYLYFDNGVLIDAEYGDRVGEAAFMAIMKVEIGAYAFTDPPEQNIPRRIRADLQELIRNAVKEDQETELPLP